MVGRPYAAAEREAGSDGSGDVGLRKGHGLWNVVAERKLAC